MTEAVYKKLELVGQSALSIEDAVRGAVALAAQHGNRIDWFEVTEIRGAVKDGEIRDFQVVMKVGGRIGD
ncbi:MAG: dodecin flavoprotein [Azospirillum sp.]|nr:dodecin flavoprotein [Azospirillum sp.]